MNRKKLLPLLLIVLGLMLLAAAGSLLLHNQQEDQAARQTAQQVLSVLETGASTPEAPSPEAAEPTDPPDPPSLSSELLDGHEYVGYLSFPSLERKLPIMKIAYLEDLQIAPCLERGSPYTDDAVISAHNYPSHFGPIRDWTGGEEVVFTSLDGQEIRYTVTIVETIEGTDVDKVMDSPYDLVLYTCTPGGAKRVMLGCDRTKQ